MTKFRLIESKSLEEEIEEIELPTFDIIVHEEETWFERAVRQIKEDEQIQRSLEQ